MHTVRTASGPDEAVVIDALTLAFGADPVTRWTWSDPHVYLASFPRFVRAFGGRAFVRGSAHYVQDHVGAALWLPPGEHPDEEAMGKLMEDTVPAAVSKDAAGLLEQMGRYHPKEPHWYLPLIGIDPAYQGKGYGGALLQHAAGMCDRAGELAYLESTNARNIPLYERHGFEVLGEIRSGSAPPLFPMLRKPRRKD
jgi:ribosomal protein S18 acetylase RimI-like enzyme